MSHCTIKRAVHALLSMAIVLIRDNNVKYQDYRALFDSVSQSHFMIRELCQRLQLSIYKMDHLISGLGQTNVLVNHRTVAQIKSRSTDYQTEMSCFVVDSITGMLPPDEINTSRFTIPTNICLADPQYNISAKIDLLIGVTLFFDLLQERRLELGNNQPILQQMKLG